MSEEPNHSNNKETAQQPAYRRRPFYSRTDEWKAVGLDSELQSKHSPAFYVGEIIVLLILLGVTLFLFANREEFFPDADVAFRVATVIVLMLIGWAMAKALGSGLAPRLLRRLDPGMAGTIGFLLRLFTMILVTMVALRVAGLNPATLAAGGAFTAIILGLAAQQTISNVFAGVVLQGTKPFRVGERVRIVAGMLAGQQEGVVSSLGLFYTTLVNGQEKTMIPNSIILGAAVVPLREPASVELKINLSTNITPPMLQKQLLQQITVPLQYEPDVTLIEMNEQQVIMNVAATPLDRRQGGQLAAEMMQAFKRLQAVKE